MRIALPLLLAAVTVSAADNTTVNGITLTNGVSSLSDSSAIATGPNKSTAVGYLTDDNTLTTIVNLGFGLTTNAIKGDFGSTLSSNATGIYLISLVTGNVTNGNFDYIYQFNGNVSVQLDLVGGGLTSKRYLTDLNYVPIAQQMFNAPYYQGINGQLGTLGGGFEKFYYAYAYISFATFKTTYDKVLSVRLADFNGQHYPEISYIGAGYGLSGAGSLSYVPPVPEPSTYGLAFGGLALVAVALRRRNKQPKA